jgi:CHAT domain-containing protein/Tfp pilus assembly protein PilF
MFHNSLSSNTEIRQFLLSLAFISIFLPAYASNCDMKYYSSFQEGIANIETDQKISDKYSYTVNNLNLLLQESIIKGDTAGSRRIINSIFNIINNHSIDSIVLSKSFYFTGVFNIVTYQNIKAIELLKSSAVIREKRKLRDTIYSKSLYHLAVAYFYLGDYYSMRDYSLKALDVDKELYEPENPALTGSLSNLLTANMELQEYEESISYGNMAVRIVEKQEGALSGPELANLYYNLGVCYIRLSDYAKAVLYLEKTVSIYRSDSLRQDDRYINLLNSMAVAYGYLGLDEKSDEYYQSGVKASQSNNSPLANNIINSYAIRLANSGRVEQGETLLVDALNRTKIAFGTDSKNYIEVLRNYAEYCRAYDIDLNKSLELFNQCLVYLEDHKEDLVLNELVATGYALSLAAAGEKIKALETIQQLIYSSISIKPDKLSLYSNPEFEVIKADQRSLRLLKTKYRILWDIYEETEELPVLIAAASTSEIIISVLEKVRINISEEESRYVLGDRYRDSYLLAIRDFDICYKITNNPEYLEKAFEYSEKSKVAGLLASTRELKATQFHIPADIADLERDLQREISLNNAKIITENSKKMPDAVLLSEWNEIILNATRRRDSLVAVFEHEFPEYFLLKYNTEVAKLNDVPEIIGLNRNYINYVVSDTLLYLFIANRKNKQLLSFRIDSSFFNNIKEFRSLLGMPSRTASARTEFNRFQKLGYYFYNTLIEPAREYLISDKIIISPDNILSYLPFETFITSTYDGEEIMYRELSFLMKRFRISYAYSVTFMSESLRKELSLTNKLIAFAPVYTGTITIDSLFRIRQTEREVLNDLPYARQEAEYVTDLTHGKLHVSKEALESVFKTESGRYDIIHLAMHTILNDQYPMHSKMIFYPHNDTIDDGLLNTYEVYGIPLNSKMVVLSSCNTGTGFLQSGEGIMSLARGFIYSGSQSVVMSLWEVEDKSGTEIIKEFYQNIKKGKTKSNALRKARIDYLKNASQLRSHPYFWGSLVVYGNNSPLYYPKYLIILVSVGFLIAASLVTLYYCKLR